MEMPDLTKLGETIERAVANEKSKCPHCGETFVVSRVAGLPERQVLHMRLESESGSFSAKTIGGVITEFDKLLKAVARDVGGKVHVFIDSVERTEKTIDFGFLITTVLDQRK